MAHARNNFDFIRLLAASLVIIGHAYVLLDEGGIPYFFGDKISTYAVKMFFVLSGFLVVNSWTNDPDPLRFVAKRTLRILPAFFAVVFFAACFLGPAVTQIPLSEYFHHDQFRTYFINLRFFIVYSLPGVFEQNIYPQAVNGSLWSLPVEVFMYLLVLAMGQLGRFLRGNSFVIAWTALAIAALTLSYFEFALRYNMLDGKVVYGVLLKSAADISPYFIIGGCLSLYANRIPLSPAISAAVVALGWYFTSIGYRIEPLLILITSYAVISFGSASTPVLREFGRFGDISYGVYLYGFPVAQTLSWAYGRDLPFSLHIFGTLAISYGLAFLSWHGIEKHALKLKPLARRKTTRRP